MDGGGEGSLFSRQHVPEVFSAAGLMVPDPSLMSLIPFNDEMVCGVE